MKITQLLFPILLTITACSSNDIASIVPDNRADYRQPKMGNPLEVPPDLTSDSLNDMLDQEARTGVSSLSTYEQTETTLKGKGSLFTEHSKNIHRAGDSRWLEFKGSNEQAWNLAIKFWQDQNIVLKKKDATIGVMETPWIQNNAGLPKSFLERTLGSVVKNIYDSGERDKFRTRIEATDGVTRIYVTHYGAEDVPLDANGKETSGEKDPDTWQWKHSNRNPDLEEEMLRQMSLYFYRKGQALQASREKGQNPTLRMASVQGQPALIFERTNYNTAWIMLGVASDRAGFDIQGQNRQQGDYKIATVDIEKSPWYSLEGDKKVTKEQYHLRLADNGEQQIAMLQTADGKQIATDKAQSILKKLSESIAL